MGTWGRNTNSRHIFRNLQSVPSASYLTHTLPFKLSPTVNMSGSDDNGSPGAQEKPEAGASDKERRPILSDFSSTEVVFNLRIVQIHLTWRTATPSKFTRSKSVAVSRLVDIGLHMSEHDSSIRGKGKGMDI